MTENIFNDFFENKKKEIQWTCREEKLQDMISHLTIYLQPGDWVFLDAELGAGKTTFIQSFLKEIDPHLKTTSPTFSILNTIQIENHKLFKKIIHLDLYRIQNPKELYYLSLEDIFQKENSLVFIEWPWNLEIEDYQSFFKVTNCEKPRKIFLIEIHGDGNHRNYILKNVDLFKI